MMSAVNSRSRLRPSSPFKAMRVRRPDGEVLAVDVLAVEVWGPGAAYRSPDRPGSSSPHRHRGLRIALVADAVGCGLDRSSDRPPQLLRDWEITPAFWEQEIAVR
jgi:hypothetical protein